MAFRRDALAPLLLLPLPSCKAEVSFCVKLLISSLLMLPSPSLSMALARLCSISFSAPAARSWADTVPSPLVSSGSVDDDELLDDVLLVLLVLLLASSPPPSGGGPPGGGPSGGCPPDMRCANSMVEDGGGIRLFMPVSSSSALRLPSPSVSIWLNCVSASAAVVPVFSAILLNMVCSSVLSTPPLPSASALLNMRAFIALAREAPPSDQALLTLPTEPRVLMVLVPFQSVGRVDVCVPPLQAQGESRQVHFLSPGSMPDCACVPPWKYTRREACNWPANTPQFRARRRGRRARLHADMTAPAIPATPATPQPHVLVVHDDSGMTDALCSYLRRFGLDAHAAAQAPQMQAHLATHDVHLVVLDIHLPGADGAALARALRERWRLPCILLTQGGTPGAQVAASVAALDLGADDAMAQPFDPRELVARIRSVLRRAGHAGAAGAAAAPAGTGELVFQGWTLRPLERALTSPQGQPVELSSAEFRLLTTFVLAPQRVMSREQLATPTQGHGSNDTGREPGRGVDLLVSRLRHKLQRSAASGDAALIKTVRGAGYLFNARPSQPQAPT